MVSREFNRSCGKLSRPCSTSAMSAMTALLGMEVIGEAAVVEAARRLSCLCLYARCTWRANVLHNRVDHSKDTKSGLLVGRMIIARLIVQGDKFFHERHGWL